MKRKINIWSLLKLNRTIIMITIILWLFSLIVERLIYIYNLYVILVSDNFITTLFSSQVSISVLSITVLTLITSSLQEKYLGYSLRDILNLEKQTLSLYGFIFTSLINIIIGAVLFAFNLTNAMFILFVYTIFIVLVFGYKILNSITNKNYYYENISNYLEKAFTQNEFENIQQSTIIFINRFMTNFRNENFEDEEEYLINFLSDICDYLTIKKCEQSQKILSYMEDAYKKLFRAYCKYYGFDKALFCFSKLLKNSYWRYIDSTIYSSVIQNLKFLNEIEIQTENIVGSLNSFEYISNIGHDTLSYLLYEYFLGIYENEAISSSYKDSIINEFLVNLTTFQQYNNSSNNLLKERLIYYIFVKVSILRRDRDVFLQIIINLYQRNEYSENKAFYHVLAYLLLGLYSYGFCEIELLSEGFRNQIKQYINISKKTINTERVVFKNLIEQYANQILCSIGEIVFNEKYDGIFEYFSRELKVKSVVWTDDFKISVMLFLHLIFYIYGRYNNILGYIENWETIDKMQQRQFLNTIVDGIIEPKDRITYKLKSNTESAFDEFCRWIGKDAKTIKSVPLFNEILKKNFESCNNILTQMIKQESIDVSNIIINTDVEQLNNVLKEQLTDEYGYDDGLLVDSKSFDLQTNPRIRNKKYINFDSIAKELKQGILKYLSTYFIKKTPAIELGFNYDGVKKLLSKLKEMRNIDVKTTQFTYDLAIDDKTRSTEEYRQLLELENKLEYKEMPHMRNNYISSDYFRFNTMVRKIDRRELTDEEVDRYSENFLVSNGLYNINGAFLNKSDAMILLKNENIVINIIFRLSTIICDKSGLHLKYSYQTRKTLNDSSDKE